MALCHERNSVRAQVFDRPLMTPDDFRAWHDAMGHTYDTGAAALGVSRGTYADWLAGRSRTTGKPIQVSRVVALACAALAAGLGEWTPPDQPDQ